MPKASRYRAPSSWANTRGTLSLNERQHWFANAQLRGTFGNAAYDGWCSPFLITPNSASPNGYELDVGDASPCSETGDKDWYVEARGLAGKDFIGQHGRGRPIPAWVSVICRMARPASPDTARMIISICLSALRHARSVASHGALSFNLEFDLLIHGWQKTRDSELGGGDVPATTTAPAFTIDGFTDISFAQPAGWALRASAKYPMTRRLSVEPYYVHWNVSASPVNYETATFTVNNVTALEQLGAYEPVNTTNEFGVRLGFHF